MKCNEIIDHALLLLGHSPLRCPPEGASGAGAPVLRQRLLQSIEPCAARLALSLFRREASLTRPLPDTTLARDSLGRLYLRLPSDYLRIALIRLSDWRRDVTETSDPLSAESAAQWSPWRGIRASEERPLCMEATITLPEGIPGRVLLLFGSQSPEPDVTEALYCPSPAVTTDDDGSLHIAWPEKLLHPLASAIAKNLRDDPCFPQ